MLQESGAKNLAGSPKDFRDKTVTRKLDQKVIEWKCSKQNKNGTAMLKIRKINVKRIIKEIVRWFKNNYWWSKD